MSDYHDFVQLAAQGQVTPTNYTQGGVMTTVSQPQYIGAQITTIAGGFGFQLTTQTNAFPGVLSSQSVTAQQRLAVAGPVYSAPGSRSAV